MQNPIVKNNYAVKGMTCAACAINLQSHLGGKEGVRSVSVNYPNESVLIEFDPDKLGLSEIQKAADEIGYQVVEESEYDGLLEYTSRLKKLKTKLIISVLLTIPIVTLSMFIKGMLPYENFFLLALSIPVIFWAGYEFFENAWKKAIHFTSNMDTLVALSTGVAFFFSLFNTLFPSVLLNRGIQPDVYYESATVIITLILLGRFLEERAKFKTTGTIKKLMGIQPKTVEVIHNGEFITRLVTDVKCDEIIRVKPGNKIALDGIILNGNSYVDESMINGEPIPAHKAINDRVYAGTINQNGLLEVKIEKDASSTLLAQIVKLIQNAQASKPPIQKIVDKIAAIFVPAVIVIALIAFSMWLWIGPDPSITYAFLILVTVLIIACPCALGLATPTALMVGIGKGAEMGILIKDAQSLEIAHKINTLVLDKTGTLTKGQPQVMDISWKNDIAIDSEKHILLELESKSDHPLAKAILNHFDTISVRYDKMDFENLPGMGIIGIKQGKKYYVGSKDLIKNNNILFSEKILVSETRLLKDAMSTVYFANEKEVICIIGIKDPLRSNAKQVIQEINALGIETVLLSGDNKQVTENIAGELNIDKFQGNVLPHEKGDYIKNLRKEGRIVGMVGDGINDSLALTVSDIGIAMGSGTDIAMESAGITLMKSDIKHIKSAISLSRETIKTINQNLVWAFAYNILAIPIAAGVLYPAFGFLLSPMIAGASMAFSSVSVVTNSLRLKNRKII